VTSSSQLYQPVPVGLVSIDVVAAMMLIWIGGTHRS